MGQPFPAFAAPLISPDIPSPDRSDWTSEVGPTGLYGGGGGGAGSTNPSYPQHPANLVVQVVVVMVLTGQLVLDHPQQEWSNYTGGGGGGGGNSSGQSPKGGFGGAGILVIRYQPGS